MTGHSVAAGNAAHWLDRLEAGVKTHIQTMQQQRDELVAQARPPQAVLDVAAADPEAVKLGAGLNKAYAAALHMGKKGQYTNVLERAKAVAEDYLAHFPPERRGRFCWGRWPVCMGRMRGERIRPRGYQEAKRKQVNLSPVLAKLRLPTK
jgi:hypothetical protein